MDQKPILSDEEALEIIFAESKEVRPAVEFAGACFLLIGGTLAAMFYFFS